MLWVFGFSLMTPSFAQCQPAQGHPAATGDHLATLRAQAKSSYQSKDKRTLVQIAASLEPLGKNKNLDIGCRLAATGIIREVKGYLASLEATDADARKIAEARVRVAAISVKRDLATCK
jgi:hypothetical protein